MKILEILILRLSAAGSTNLGPMYCCFYIHNDLKRSTELVLQTIELRICILQDLFYFLKNVYVYVRDMIYTAGFSDYGILMMLYWLGSAFLQLLF